MEWKRRRELCKWVKVGVDLVHAMDGKRRTDEYTKALRPVQQNITESAVDL